MGPFGSARPGPPLSSVGQLLSGPPEFRSEFLSASTLACSPSAPGNSRDRRGRGGTSGTRDRKRNCRVGFGAGCVLLAAAEVGTVLPQPRDEGKAQNGGTGKTQNPGLGPGPPNRHLGCSAWEWGSHPPPWVRSSDVNRSRSTQANVIMPAKGPCCRCQPLCPQHTRVNTVCTVRRASKAPPWYPRSPAPSAAGGPAAVTPRSLHTRLGDWKEHSEAGSPKNTQIPTSTAECVIRTVRSSCVLMLLQNIWQD
ncbi:uncharacterized protein LOC104849897 [Fukomys damarensis]|uniref:uncharacterized protein LOC104849897 n=1 Tax=Fukomys damarensis TaxID=885580 RepID=UPI00053FD5EE|nr:uncharacterized protein LOC104849897 [Fukomys damarensis]